MCMPDNRHASFLRSLSSIQHNRREAVRDGRKESDCKSSGGAEIHGARPTKRGRSGTPIREKCDKRVVETTSSPRHPAASILRNDNNNDKAWPELPFSREETMQPLHKASGHLTDTKLRRLNSALRSSAICKDPELRRRVSVTFAPELSSCHNDNGDNDDVEEAAAVEERIEGFREDYSLGETARDPSHIRMTVGAASSLKRHDFAFVKRRDGSYSYAILAYRSKMPVKSSCQRRNSTSTKKLEDDSCDIMEECMVFVVDGVGSTKTIRQRHWDNSVRLVAALEE